MSIDGTVVSSFLELFIPFVVYLFFAFGAFAGKINCQPTIRRVTVLCYVLFSAALILLFLRQGSAFAQHRTFALVAWVAASSITGLVLLRSHWLQLLFFVIVVLTIQSNILQISQIICHMQMLPPLFACEPVQSLLIRLLVLLVFIPPMWYLFYYLLHWYSSPTPSKCQIPTRISSVLFSRTKTSSSYLGPSRDIAIFAA